LTDEHKEQNNSQRKSLRLSAKNSKGKSIIMLADLAAKKGGILNEEDALDIISLQ
jgi:hypothetical protein